MHTVDTGKVEGSGGIRQANREDGGAINEIGTDLSCPGGSGVIWLDIHDDVDAAICEQGSGILANDIDNLESQPQVFGKSSGDVDIDTDQLTIGNAGKGCMRRIDAYPQGALYANGWRSYLGCSKSQTRAGVIALAAPEQEHGCCQRAD
jgi:hypothetical protein